MPRQTIKECNDIIKSQAERIEELEAKAAKDQQTVLQYQCEISELKDQMFVVEEEVDALDEEVLDLKDQLENAHEIEDGLREYIQTLLTRISEREHLIDKMDAAIGDLCKLCEKRYKTIAEQSTRISDLESELSTLVELNIQQRDLLDDGVEVAEETIDMLNKYQPCVRAYNQLIHLVNDDECLFEVLDDAAFLDALYPQGGKNIRDLVRFILELVP